MSPTLNLIKSYVLIQSLENEVTFLKENNSKDGLAGDLEQDISPNSGSTLRDRPWKSPWITWKSQSSQFSFISTGLVLIGQTVLHYGGTFRKDIVLLFNTYVSNKDDFRLLSSLFPKYIDSQEVSK